MESCNRMTITPGVKCVSHFPCVSVNNVIENELILGNVCRVPGGDIVCYDLVQEFSNYLCFKDRTYWRDGSAVIVFNGCGGSFQLCYKQGKQTTAMTPLWKTRGNSTRGVTPSNTPFLTTNGTVLSTPVSNNTRTYVTAGTAGVCGLICLIFLVLIIYHLRNKIKRKRFHTSIYRRPTRFLCTSAIPDVNLDDAIQSITNGDVMSRSTEHLTLAASNSSEYARVKRSRPKPDVCDVISTDTNKVKKKAPPVPVRGDKVTDSFYGDNHFYNRLHHDLHNAVGKRQEKLETEEDQNIYNMLKERRYNETNRGNGRADDVIISDDFSTVRAKMSRHVPNNYRYSED